MANTTIRQVSQLLNFITTMRILVLILTLACLNTFAAEFTPEQFNQARQMADKGMADAQAVLAYCYYTGEGVAKDQVEAVKWYRKAAEQGYAIAQYNLGLKYDSGEGAPKDQVEAYALFNLAGIKCEDARKYREILERTITASQIEAGQRRTKELQKEIEENIAKKAGK